MRSRGEDSVTPADLPPATATAQRMNSSAEGRPSLSSRRVDVDTAPIVLRRVSILAIAFVAVIAACTGSGDDDDDAASPSPPATLTVTYVYPASPDPLAGIGAWRVTVTSAGNTVVAQEFADGDPMELGVDGMANVTLILEGCVPAGCASGVLSRGRTLAFDLTGSTQTVSMWFARTNTFSTSNGTYLARSEPAVFPLPDGRVLIAGGNPAAPVTNVDVYDPSSDGVSAGPALPLANAQWAAVPLDAETLLLAGGRNAIDGARSDAMVFEFDAAAVGTWTVAAPMGITRNDPMGAPIGRRGALIAGGRAGATYRATTEAFRWDGVAGTWEPGADLASPLLGGVAVQVGTNAVLVGGGFSVETGVESFKSAIALLDSNAGLGWTRTAAGSFTRTRSHAGVVAVAEDEWLVVGGWNGNVAPYTPIRISDRLVWNGATAVATTSGRTALAQALGGGARLPDGRYLFVGGDTANKDEPSEPVDEALIWDPVTGDFASVGSTPGATVHATVVPLADGTSLVVTDAGVFRFNP